MFGLRIKNVRHERGLSLPALAKLLGISEFELIAIEHGRHRVGPELIVDLCEALGMTIVDFMSGL